MNSSYIKIYGNWRYLIRNTDKTYNQLTNYKPFQQKMKFFAILSLTAAVAQGARLTHKESVEASELIQAFERIADLDQQKEHAKVATKEYTQVETATLAKLSARLDAMEDAQWNLFKKARNWVQSQPAVQKVMENPIAQKIAESDAVQNALSQAEDATNGLQEQVEDKIGA